MQTHVKMTKTEYINLYLEAGYILTPLNGKIPVKKGWQDTDYDPLLTADDFPANFGVVIHDTLCVLDIDPRNFPENDKPHVRLFSDFGIKKADCVIVITGSGGMHALFRIPPGIHLKEKLTDYPGIEFKTKGRQVVGAGSIHPDTGRPYELKVGDLKNLPELPPALLKLLSIQKREREKHVENELSKYDDRLENIERFTEYLEHIQPAVEGQQGDNHTYRVACEGRNFGLSPRMTLDLMLKIWNPDCVPPWSVTELEEKVTNAYKFAQGEAGKRTAHFDFGTVTISSKERPKYPYWDRSKSGTVQKTANNVANYFVYKKYSELFESLVFDEFSGRIMVTKRLPWMKSFPEKGLVEWRDGDSKSLRYYLGWAYRQDYPRPTIDDAIYSVATERTLNPLQDFLNSLKWDGEKRLDRWLTTYAGVEDSLYTREVGKCALLQAVARAFEPGCKADHVIIFEGKQGLQKSQFIQAIASKRYYRELTIDPKSRDTVDAMRGCWIVEFAEMEVTRRADAQQLKAFITRETDRVRLAYGSKSDDYPRFCVFWGTHNPDATGEYLYDSTGNRRFWPVYCTRLNLDALKRDREQLLAETVARYKAGEKWYIEDEVVLGIAQTEQEKRRVKDPYGAMIQEFLLEFPLAKDQGFVTTKDIWIYCLKGNENSLSNHHSRRIADSLRDLGWTGGVYKHPDSGVKIRAFRNYQVRGRYERQDEAEDQSIFS